jgi:hypothetical protein
VLLLWLVKRCLRGAWRPSYIFREASNDATRKSQISISEICDMFDDTPYWTRAIYLNDTNHWPLHLCGVNSSSKTYIKDTTIAYLVQ